MPVTVKKVGDGPKPWKIVEVRTGRIEGESSNREDAEASARIINEAIREKERSRKNAR